MGPTTFQLGSISHRHGLQPGARLQRRHRQQGYGLCRHRRRSEAVILSTGTPIPAQWTRRRRCRDGPAVLVLPLGLLVLQDAEVARVPLQRLPQVGRQRHRRGVGEPERVRDHRRRAPEKISYGLYSYGLYSYGQRPSTTSA